MQTRSILLIEYESNIREVLKICLSEFGKWKVTPSSSVHQGLNLCRATQPDAILLDTSTPETDAVLFVEELKMYSVTHSIPILLISSRAELFSPTQLREMGFAGVIEKPFNPVTLTQQVSRLLGWNGER